MIRNIVFDMGNVMIYFNKNLFLDRAGVTGEDRRLLERIVFDSLEWARLDRGSLLEPEAERLMCSRLPERLHGLPVEGMEELIAELKEKGYGIYLLSNASYRQHEYWPRIPASRFFDGTLISADVKLVKPQPEIYRLLCETFSLIPDECVFIDDAINNAEGAFLCGMHPIVFHDDVAELRARLRELDVPV